MFTVRNDEGVISQFRCWKGHVKWREPVGRPEFHMPDFFPDQTISLICTSVSIAFSSAHNQYGTNILPMSTTGFIVIRQIQEILFCQLILNQTTNFTSVFKLWYHPLRQSNGHQFTSQMIWFLFSAGSRTSSASHFHLQIMQIVWLACYAIQYDTTIFMNRRWYLNKPDLFGWSFIVQRPHVKPHINMRETVLILVYSHRGIFVSQAGRCPFSSFTNGL